MRPRALLGLAGLTLGLATTAAAQPPMPGGLRGLGPRQVVENVLARGTVLALTPDQVLRLESLAGTLAAEPHRYTHGGGKPHVTRHVPMTSARQAFARTAAVLTPGQQALLSELFPAPPSAGRLPRVTRLGGKP